VHTAVKIEPHYHGATVHVLDASRTWASSALLSEDKRDAFAKEVKDEYIRVRKAHAGREPQARLLSLEDARNTVSTSTGKATSHQSRRSRDHRVQ